MKRFAAFIVAMGSLMVISAGCERKGGKLPSTELPPVPVSSPVEEEVEDTVDYSGRTNAENAVTVQPRVTGYLLKPKNPFKEGADVKEGDLLFEIDRRPYEAQLEAAKAQVAQNEASLKYAVATNARYKELDKKQKGAVSERQLDQYQALEDQAIANLNLAKASLASAALNLEWTKVKAPISGRISRYYLTPGNLVNQDVTQLTTVVSMDPMYVYFDMDEPTLLKITRSTNEGLTVANKKVPVRMGVVGEDGYPHEGYINFVDNQVNPGTGSISVRGVFPNTRPEGGTYLLVPGMFVRVRLPIGEKQKQLLVIDRAITSDQGLKYVYVVDKDNKVEARRVTTGSLQENGRRVITQGLTLKDKVIIGGLQQVRPHMTVQTEAWEMPTLANPTTPQAQPKQKGKDKGKQGAGKKGKA